jgi:hypothetical protein
MIEALIEYLESHDETVLQRAADRKCGLLDAADEQDPELDAFMDAVVEDPFDKKV